MDDLAGKVQPDGFLGRNYNQKGEYDSTCAPDWPLIALDYIAARTEEQEIPAGTRPAGKLGVPNIHPDQSLVWLEFG